MKACNAYQLDYPNYNKTPKAVLAAIAYSMALMRCEDDPAEARKMLAYEWGILHLNGIVPQKPKV